MSPVTSFDVRAALEDLLERDLLGPWDGSVEELLPGSTPGERYLLGRLVPRRPEGAEPVTDAEQAPEDDGVEDRPELMDEQGLGLDPDDREAPPSVAAIRSRAMAASSLGLAFQVPTDTDTVVVDASWGRYSPGSSEHHQTPTGRPSTVWKRESAGGRVEVPVGEEGSGSAVPDGHSEGVVVRWTVRHRSARRVVEADLVPRAP